MKKALLVIDVQNDFCKGGSLEVSGANEIISGINALMENTNKEYDLIVATKDFHPQDHSSFKSNNSQGIWVDHCVQGTLGAEFHQDLKENLIDIVVNKGTDTAVDSYSGFFDNDHVKSTGLDEILKKHGITHIDVVGLALDYCVKATAIDGANLGFNTTVIPHLTRAVNINPNDGDEAIKELLNNNIGLSW